MMTTNLHVGERFPDIVLPNYMHEMTRLSHLTRPSLMDQKLGFGDGYPLILVFFRGFFCPRDQQQMRLLVQFQAELAVNKQINILDETEGEYAYRAQPYTFVLRPDLTIHQIYNGWFFVGRPTLEELRRDLRAVMETLAYYSYEAYDTPVVRRIRIPQQEWAAGAPPLGANGLPVARGLVRWFDLASGNGGIAPEDGGDEVFFNF